MSENIYICFTIKLRELFQFLWNLILWSTFLRQYCPRVHWKLHILCNVSNAWQSTASPTSTYLTSIAPAPTTFLTVNHRPHYFLQCIHQIKSLNWIKLTIFVRLLYSGNWHHLERQIILTNWYSIAWRGDSKEFYVVSPTIRPFIRFSWFLT